MRNFTLKRTTIVFFLLAFFTFDAISQIQISEKNVNEMIQFTKSMNSDTGLVYEVMPGPAAINPDMSPTPFSDSLRITNGTYMFEVEDVNDVDSPESEDSVFNVDIRFTASNGQVYLVDSIGIIHKEQGQGHTFFGGVGLNKVMHGNTGIGNGLMPKLMSYITLWGITDLKDAATDTVVASNRLIHIMTTTKVRDDSLHLITSTEIDSTNYNFWDAHTHIILPPQDTEENPDPVPGTPHGFLHMMYENVMLLNPNRDWTLAYEVLPGPAAINPEMSPTPFSDKISLGAGSYHLSVIDRDELDSESSRDSVLDVNIRYERPNGEVRIIDSINIIHKPQGAGDHTFFGGVGYNKTMHGNTGIGNPLMPKLMSYITLWGIADLEDGEGNVLASDRLIHIMVSTRVRTDSLKLITTTETDESDHSEDKRETHVILPPQDTDGNMSPVPNTRYGFLHLMYEEVSLKDSTATGLFDRYANNGFSVENYPNPFKDYTTLQYELPKTTDVSLELYNFSGKKVKTYSLENQQKGLNRFEINARDLNNAPGIYFYQIIAGKYSGSGKLILTE
jgi:hypothetical protein